MMKINFDQLSAGLYRKAFAASLVLAFAFATATPAPAQTLRSPSTPAIITPPAGTSAFLLGRATGTQGYVCLPTPTGASWTVNGARPEATLFTSIYGLDFQIITHFLSPNTNPNEFAPNPLPFGNATWQSSLDSSKVWAQVQKSIPAGSDPSCPNNGSIACLLLQVIGADDGPTGGKSLSKTLFIQRLNTKAGVAPAEGCALATDVDKQALVPYTADYYFFKKN
ncbi:MAG: DUF3455 domain-containing protein [Candidatus Solibacter sp.]